VVRVCSFAAILEGSAFKITDCDLEDRLAARSWRASSLVSSNMKSRREALDVPSHGLLQDSHLDVVQRSQILIEEDPVSAHDENQSLDGLERNEIRIHGGLVGRARVRFRLARRRSRRPGHVGASKRSL